MGFTTPGLTPDGVNLPPRRISMNESTISIPIPASDFIELVDFLREQGSKRDPVAAVRDAIAYWIDNASWKQEDLLNKAFVKPRGYRWKEVFLPHATLIRMKYKGRYHYAKVDGDAFVFNGMHVSPGEFANRVTSSSRNAWRDLEIRRPGDDEWMPADLLRQRARDARRRYSRLETTSGIGSKARL